MSKSVITLRPSALDNGVFYTCEVQHPALAAPLRQTVQLAVQFPHGPPELVSVRAMISDRMEPKT